MKRALLIAALVGMIATPAAFAEMDSDGIYHLGSAFVDVSPVGGTPRDGLGGGGGLAGYKPNDPFALYDTMWGDPFGPLLGGPAQYNAGASPYLGGGTTIFDDIRFKPTGPANPGYGLLQSLAWLWYNPGDVGMCVEGRHTIVVQFFSNYNGYIGYPIQLSAANDPNAPFNGGYGLGFNASCGFVIGRFFFGYVDGNPENPERQIALPKDFWIGIRHITPGVTQVMGTAYDNAVPPNVGHVHGQASTAGSGSLPGAVFQGTGSMDLGFVTGGGSGFISSAGSIMLTLYGDKVPEPATIGFLALGGLLILRRRRA